MSKISLLDITKENITHGKPQSIFDTINSLIEKINGNIKVIDKILLNFKIVKRTIANIIASRIINIKKIRKKCLVSSKTKNGFLSQNSTLK